MSDAWIALAGVGVGSLITGLWTFYVHNSGVAEARRDALLTRLDRLLSAATQVEAAVQRFVGFANLFRHARPAADIERHLEEAGTAAGAIPVGCFALEALAREVDDDGPLFRAAKSYSDAALAVIRSPMPTSATETTPEQLAVVARRDELVSALGARLAAARAADITFRSRWAGRFDLA